MKKFMMIAVLAVAALTANAQDHKWTITPHLGLGYTKISGLTAGANGENFEDGMGATLGADFMYMPTEHFGISAGLDFRYLESAKEVNNWKFKFAFVEIPILAHYNFTSHFGIFAGAKVNFIQDAKLSGKDVDVNLKDGCRTTVSIPVGISYTFNKPWVLSAYYDIPTSNTAKSGETWDDKSEVNLKTNNIYVTIAYKFNL